MNFINSHFNTIPPFKYGCHFLRLIIFVIIVGGASTLVWLTPPVLKLKWGSVLVDRWDKTMGHIQYKVGVLEPDWVNYEDFSKHALNALVVAEDSRFFQHYGIDLREIFLSWDLNKREARIVRGASTITQQVVKITFLDKERTYLRKLKEILGALVLELFLSKNEILAWYANIVDFGNGSYGLKQASRLYFNTRPELLSVSQSVHLALVVPSPNKWSYSLKQKHLTPFAAKRFARILREMRANNYISDLQRQQAIETGDFGNPVTE